MDERLQALRKYNLWDSETIADSFEKVLVSFNDLTPPLRGGIHHVQAWRLTEPL